MSDARPRKRSLTLQGHRTSVSLEDAFWVELQRIAADRGTSMNALVAEIDAARGVSAGLASAIRVFILEQAKARP
ncbi:ribbon-helix-helix domain-containing protein [Gymnodinialimonas sp. 2305UL16-5]|uniref:ribbon-helix-helix domain-containing protein n=1 Tax=Gymnodinialimonas mytili TaxID=3126503 RepID=UPI00309B645A